MPLEQISDFFVVIEQHMKPKPFGNKIKA